MNHHVYVDTLTGAAGYQADLILDGPMYEDPTTRPVSSGESRRLRFMQLGSRAGDEFMRLTDNGRVAWLGNPLKVRNFLRDKPTMRRPLARRG